MRSSRNVVQKRARSLLLSSSFNSSCESFIRPHRQRLTARNDVIKNQSSKSFCSSSSDTNRSRSVITQKSVDNDASSRVRVMINNEINDRFNGRSLIINSGLNNRSTNRSNNRSMFTTTKSVLSSAAAGTTKDNKAKKKAINEPTEMKYMRD